MVVDSSIILEFVFHFKKKKVSFECLILAHFSNAKHEHKIWLPSGAQKVYIYIIFNIYSLLHWMRCPI